MKIYAAVLDLMNVILFENREEAIGCAGDYWSLLPKKHDPVKVVYYHDTLYRTLPECQHAADLNLPWIARAGVVVWKNGTITRLGE